MDYKILQFAFMLLVLALYVQGESLEGDYLLQDVDADALPVEIESRKVSRSKRPLYCYLYPEKGHCEYQYLRFYFDYTTNNCKAFIYSGCGGNKNNFESYKRCQRICQAA